MTMEHDDDLIETHFDEGLGIIKIVKACATEFARETGNGNVKVEMTHCGRGRVQSLVFKARRGRAIETIAVDVSQGIKPATAAAIDKWLSRETA